MTESRLCW